VHYPVLFSKNSPAIPKKVYSTSQGQRLKIFESDSMADLAVTYFSTRKTSVQAGKVFI
jgi:hypothetical protein